MNTLLDSVIMWDSPSGRKLDTMHFNSAVMALAWHPDEVSKLLVAQKTGVLHIVNAVSFRVRVLLKITIT